MTLAKSRTRAHQLRIETSPYQKLDDEDRICLLCDLGKIKSEIHSLMDYSYLSGKKGIIFQYCAKKIIQYFKKVNSYIIILNIGRVQFSLRLIIFHYLFPYFLKKKMNDN